MNRVVFYSWQSDHEPLDAIQTNPSASASLDFNEPMVEGVLKRVGLA
ncbi:MAG: hypothetical protein ACLP59_07905 [Bryobacteraceae bacterium]